MGKLNFIVDERPLGVEVENLVIAGWTGRDAQAVEDHIAELETIGVARPRSVPCFYRAGKNLVTTGSQLDVCGSESSGEAEFVLVSTGEGVFVGVGSDHTDRKVEAYGVTISKQVCPKPIGRELWRLKDVEEHWDALRLRSWVTIGGERRQYQEGSVMRMRTPSDLVSRYLQGGQELPVGTVMYCGTLAVLGLIASGETFDVELEDTVLHRSLRHTYTTRSLAIVD